MNPHYELKEKGYSKGHFPFSSYELNKIIVHINGIQEKALFERKDVFSQYSSLKDYFKIAISRVALEVILTDYCFYIEKNQSKNWPLAMHRDVNFPDYVKNFPDFDLDWHGVSSLKGLV